ncbi:UDP-glucosyltransferase 2-like [Neocloeon triangulifer]|uniref:UDP-glucosyltransferase 2-like n=1 Tax=Neocloeon triangulifer TaxID=2078957 RepID=UPI00286EDF51|nr:UDP-glucosyltransferase 2-like [Neocloeon triangulifer]
MIMKGLFILATLLTISDGARILAFLPLPGKSHSIVFTSLTQALAAKGHQLVVVSAFPLAKPPANYTDINLWESMKPFLEAEFDASIYEYADEKVITIPFRYLRDFQIYGEIALRDPQVANLLKDTEGFDLVIAEDFMTDATFGFAYHFKAPLVLISSMGGFYWTNHAVGNPVPTSYVTNSVLPFTSKMTFWERLVNTAFSLYWDLGSEILYFPKQEKLKDEIFGPGVPSVKELRKSASLVLVNNHYSFNYPRPLVPAFVEVGGMHVKPATKPLPKDIKEWLDGAKDGAIYFTMGSIMNCSLFPETQRKALVEAFAELPQRVLWKWETESIPGQPKNVKVASWMPQQEILAHHNVKLFITHGGLLGAQEAMYHGVPIIGIPVFGDQKLNVNRAVNSGYGLRLDLFNITKDSALRAIKKALTDKRISEEAKRRSKVFHDQPKGPLERAVFWIEYVIRHNGAHHLRSAALDLSCMQLALLDVYAFILVIFAITLAIPVLICKKLCCKSKRNSIKDKSKAKKKL